MPVEEVSGDLLSCEDRSVAAFFLQVRNDVIEFRRMGRVDLTRAEWNPVNFRSR